MNEDTQLSKWNNLALLEAQLVKICCSHLAQRRDTHLMDNLFSFLRPCEIVIKLLPRAVELSQNRNGRFDADHNENTCGGIHRTILLLLRSGERFATASTVWMDSDKSSGTHGLRDDTPRWYFEQALLCIIQTIHLCRSEFPL